MLLLRLHVGFSHLQEHKLNIILMTYQILYTPVVLKQGT